MKPDVWFDPRVIFKVKCADLSISPRHFAAKDLVDSDKVTSLRIPRFLRIRDDENGEDATTPSEVATMYKNQVKIREDSTRKTYTEADDDDIDF
ncbi:tRNA ligase [Parelaphostrongylus tenuis]|uniref:tRNA ligase n=1 Tax=Parelaphostrongylus tenuis TaxID=148309 RepID=A0AAD5WHS0_PARTN|nr:tRNA ligase [Parelaphostrongylus tenuis]